MSPLITGNNWPQGLRDREIRASKVVHILQRNNTRGQPVLGGPETTARIFTFRYFFSIQQLSIVLVNKRMNRYLILPSQRTGANNGDGQYQLLMKDIFTP